MWATRNTEDSVTMSKSIGGGLEAFVPCSRDKTRLFRIGNEIHFSDDVTYDTMHDLVKALKEIEAESLDNVAACTKAFVLSNAEKKTVDMSITAKPILLYITTHGGSVYAALKVIDVIQNLKIPVHTIVSSYVASAGTLLSLAGKKRYIMQHSFMLIHELRGSFWGKHSDAREQLGNMDKIMDLVKTFYIEKTKITEEEMKEILGRDRNLNVEECIEKGLVDEIMK